MANPKLGRGQGGLVQEPVMGLIKRHLWMRGLEQTVKERKQ